MVALPALGADSPTAQTPDEVRADSLVWLIIKDESFFGALPVSPPPPMGFYAWAVALSLLLLGPCVSILPYGHAFNTPGDFSEAEYAFIAATYPVFTVEKRHASGVYGNPSAPAGSPRKFNSIAASVGTARKIKALNPAARVLLYWNAMLHYNMYECEEDVQPSWLKTRGSQPQPVYVYS